jgi:uncharacterized protein
MSEGTFDKLREQLELQEWPNVYLFKFIVPNTPHLLAQTTALFDETAHIQFHESSSQKFVSVSVKEMMLNVDSIIAIYNKAQRIEGIISL